MQVVVMLGGKNTCYFPKGQALLQSQPSGCKAENEKWTGKANLNLHPTRMTYKNIHLHM